MVEVDVGILGVRGVASTDAGSEEAAGKAALACICHRTGHGHQEAGRRTGKAWSSWSIQISSGAKTIMFLFLPSGLHAVSLYWIDNWYVCGRDDDDLTSLLMRFYLVMRSSRIPPQDS